MFCTDRTTMLYGWLVNPSGVTLTLLLFGAVVGIALYVVIDVLTGPRK